MCAFTCFLYGHSVCDVFFMGHGGIRSHYSLHVAVWCCSRSTSTSRITYYKPACFSSPENLPENLSDFLPHSYVLPAWLVYFARLLSCYSAPPLLLGRASLLLLPPPQLALCAALLQAAASGAATKMQGHDSGCRRRASRHSARPATPSLRSLPPCWPRPAPPRGHEARA